MKNGKKDQVDRAYYCKFVKGDKNYFDPEDVRGMTNTDLQMATGFLVVVGLLFIIGSILPPIEETKDKEKSLSIESVSEPTGYDDYEILAESTSKPTPIKMSAEERVSVIAKKHFTGEIELNGGGTIIIVNGYKIAFLRGARDVLEGRLSDTINDIFNNEDCNELPYLCFVINAEVIDSYGQSGIKTCCTIRMNRELSDKINWDMIYDIDIKKLCEIENKKNPDGKLRWLIDSELKRLF